MDCTSVGSFFAELRKEKGLTQAELAERVGVTGGAVSKWERGLCYPDIETVVRLAEVLGLSVGEILAGQRIQVYTPETVDTLAKESIAAYSGSERRRMLRRMGGGAGGAGAAGGHPDPGAGPADDAAAGLRL